MFLIIKFWLRYRNFLSSSLHEVCSIEGVSLKTAAKVGFNPKKQDCKQRLYVPVWNTEQIGSGGCTCAAQVSLNLLSKPNTEQSTINVLIILDYQVMGGWKEVVGNLWLDIFSSIYPSLY